MRLFLLKEKKPLSFNYLNMICDVKMCLAKLKERKGKE